MFLELEDYKTVCSQRELDVLMQSDTRTCERAERVALAEMTGYLAARYDTEALFGARGDDRNPHLVQMAVNIVLFYLVQWLPGKMASGNRSDLYNLAIAWLKAAEKGNHASTLPSKCDSSDNPAEAGFPATYGGMSAQKYDY